MSDSKIIYALIGKGAIPLVQYSSFTGTFDQYCINYLINVGPGTSAAVKSGDYIIYYINSNNITYLLMTYNTYPKEAAIGCLDSIKKEFTNTYSSTDSFNEKFCLQEQFKDKLRMKYDYFNANKDVSNESIGELKEQMNKMKDEILNASGLLDERGSKIKVLDEKSDALSRDSNTFYRQSKRVKRAEMMKKIKMYAGIACAVLLVIYIIIAISCGSLIFRCG